MGNLVGVSVEELVHELKSKNARMPFEIGAFVALETAEVLLKGPARVTPKDVRITEDGALSVFVAPGSATDDVAAQSTVDLLTYLLVAAGHGVPPVFLEIVEVPPAERGWDLSRLREELEASLVPLNRLASRRVLARLIREASRAGSIHHGPIDDVAPDQATVDAELDALLGGDDALDVKTPLIANPTATKGNTSGGVVSAPPGISAPGLGPRQSRSPRSVGQGAPEPRVPTPAFGVESPAAPPEAAPSPRPPVSPSGRVALGERVARAETPDAPAPRPRAAVEADEDAGAALPGPVQSAPPSRPGPRDVDAQLFDDAPRAGGGGKWLVIFGVLIALLVGLVAWLKPEVVGRLRGEAPPPEAAVRSPAPKPEAALPFGTLRVRVAEEAAQVLLLVGEGPAVAENLPVGVAHEFVVIADGKSPSRAVVPHDAVWEPGARPRYELAIQAGDVPVPFEKLDLGKSKLAADAMGRPTGALGDVRVITTPPRARVYVLIGFAPLVEVENLRTDRDHELVVFAPGAPPERAAVPAAGWAMLDGKRVQELTVTVAKAR